MSFLKNLVNGSFTRSKNLSNGNVQVKHRAVFWKRWFHGNCKRNFAKHHEGKPQFTKNYVDGEPVIPVEYSTTWTEDDEELVHVIMYDPSYVDDGEQFTEM